jgi:hypothetical protein
VWLQCPARPGRTRRCTGPPGRFYSAACWLHSLVVATPAASELDRSAAERRFEGAEVVRSSESLTAEFYNLAARCWSAGVLVVCPRCRGQAVVPRSELGQRPQLICVGCGHTRKDVRRYQYWLRADFRGHTLWALNAAHLMLLERYIASDLRTEPMWPQASKDDRRLLPKWMCVAKNRAGLLRTIRKLRDRLAPDAEPGAAADPAS